MESSIKTVEYYFSEYIGKINGGGSFTGQELLELFKQFEKDEMIKKLEDEINYLQGILQNEDWEIDKSTFDFIMKNGRNRIKKIIGIIKENLKLLN